MPGFNRTYLVKTWEVGYVGQKERAKVVLFDAEERNGQVHVVVQERNQLSDDLNDETWKKPG